MCYNRYRNQNNKLGGLTMLQFDGVKQGGIYITGDEEINSYEEIFSTIKDNHRLFVKKTNIDGIYTYGCEQLVDNWEHKKGYIWSSRPSVMNKVFDTKLIYVYYRAKDRVSYRYCAIDIEHLDELLEGTEYEVDTTPIVDESDIEYRVITRR